MRLLLPHLEKERVAYGIKEVNIIYFLDLSGLLVSSFSFFGGNESFHFVFIHFHIKFCFLGSSSGHKSIIEVVVQH